MKKNKFRPRAAQPTPPAPSPQAKWKTLWRQWQRPLIFIGGGLALWVFCTLLYGAVFHSAEQSSYVSQQAVTMRFLTDQTGGQCYLWGRYLLLIFHSPWIGGTLLALWLTAVAWAWDRILRCPRSWSGITFLLPIGWLAYVASQGLNLYYQHEPSRFVLEAFGMGLLTAVCSLSCLWRKKPVSPSASGKPWGGLVALLAMGGLYTYTWQTQQNAIYASRMQALEMQQDWKGLVDLGAAARQPTRTIVAYYAMGLVHEQQLLEKLFNIDFHYPPRELSMPRGGSEYDFFATDANFETGLVQPAYHSALENMVTNGPSVRMLKRCVLCCLLLDQPALANKYLFLLEQTPLEADFVQACRPFVGHFERVKADPYFASILQLQPQEKYFEQNYRQPIFMGYHAGLMAGPNEVLPLSVAACLYSKDLRGATLRMTAMCRMGYSLPLVAQEALAIASLSHPELEQQFHLNPLLMNRLQAFLVEAAPYQGQPEVMTKQMKEHWLGTYFYYYYCGNNQPEQILPTSPQGKVN